MKFIIFFLCYLLNSGTLAASDYLMMKVGEERILPNKYTKLEITSNGVDKKYFYQDSSLDLHFYNLEDELMLSLYEDLRLKNNFGDFITEKWGKLRYTNIYDGTSKKLEDIPRLKSQNHMKLIRINNKPILVYLLYSKCNTEMITYDIRENLELNRVTLPHCFEPKYPDIRLFPYVSYDQIWVYLGLEAYYNSSQKSIHYSINMTNEIINKFIYNNHDIEDMTDKIAKNHEGQYVLFGIGKGHAFPSDDLISFDDVLFELDLKTLKMKILHYYDSYEAKSNKIEPDSLIMPNSLWNGQNSFNIDSSTYSSFQDIPEPYPAHTYSSTGNLYFRYQTQEDDQGVSKTVLYDFKNKKEVFKMVNNICTSEYCHPVFSFIDDKIFMSAKNLILRIK